MNLREHVAALLASRQPGFALPGAFFTDEALYHAELEYIFARHWLFLAAEAEIPEGGDYRTYQVGPYPIFLLRRDDGSVGAFHNTCRHRGSRILQHDTASPARRSCAPTTAGPTTWRAVSSTAADRGAAAAQPPLKPVHVRCSQGLMFVCLADEPPADFEDMAQRMRRILRPHVLGHTKVAKQVDIIEHGNWKLTIENNRECFHCAGHPELLNSLFEFFGEIDEAAHLGAGDAQLLPLPGCARESEALWQRSACPGSLIEELHGRPPPFAPSAWCSTAPGNR